MDKRVRRGKKVQWEWEALVYYNHLWNILLIEIKDNAVEESEMEGAVLLVYKNIKKM